MTPQTIIDDLYRELLLVPIVLLLILLTNSIVLYKQKLKSLLSSMILAAIIMCLFELLWDFCDGKPGIKILAYVGACGYILAFVVFGILFNHYFLRQFDKQPKSKTVMFMIYNIPLMIMLIFCVTTPWTRMLIWVDEQGIVQEGILFSTLFYGVLLAYLLPSLVLAGYHLFSGRKKDPAKTRTAIGLIVFGILGPLIFILQMIVLGDPESDYYSLSLAVTIALVFLTTYVSTYSLLDKQSKYEAVETELRIAAGIQTGVLPPVAPEFAEHLDVNIRACMYTAKEVGGDFYDYFVIDDSHIGFLIADVSGKGTPAALFMMTAKTMLKDYALEHTDTGEIFTAVNLRLSENNDAGMFATAWIAILDTKTKILQYTNAGHNYPLFMRKGDKCVMLKKVHGMFLAGMDDTEYSHEELQLKPGDRILLYTDGATEAHDPEKNLYGTERLKMVLEKSVSLKGEEVLDSIIKDIENFVKGEPQFDDITMLMLEIKE